MMDPGPILTRLGLQQYIDTFTEEGFETWESILDITESDLDALKVKRGHRRILQREVASARGMRIDQLSALHSPSHVSLGPRQPATDDGTDFPGSESAPRQKRRYRRHPKPDEHAPERPPSAYVLFSNKVRDELKPLNLSFTEIAKRVGESWQDLSPEGKKPYETHASASKEKYNREMASYKMTDSFREYQRYLADFRAKQGNHTDEQHPRLEHEHSNTSGSSFGTGMEGCKDCYDPARRRLDPTNSSAFATENAHHSPLGGSFSNQRSASLTPTARESSTSNPSLIPTARKDLSPATDESSNDPRQDRTVLPGSVQQRLPRIVPSEPSLLSSGSVKTPPYVSGSLQSRRSPDRGPDQIPSMKHQSSSYASDTSSKSSGQSSIMTAATSLSIHNSSDDEGKQVVVLPPISSLTGLSREVPAMDHHSGRMIAHGATGAGMATYGGYRAPQPSLAPLSETNEDQVSGAPRSDLFLHPGIGGVERKSSEPRIPRGRQAAQSGADVALANRPDPLSLLAEAAGSTRHGAPGPARLPR